MKSWILVNWRDSKFPTKSLKNTHSLIHQAKKRTKELERKRKSKKLCSGGRSDRK